MVEMLSSKWTREAAPRTWRWVRSNCRSAPVLRATGMPTWMNFLYVLEGSGTFILTDIRHAVEKGGTIFIPKGSWHGFENPDSELLLLWIVVPAGLEDFFREIASPPEASPKQLSAEQVLSIRHRLEAEQRKRVQSVQ